MYDAWGGLSGLSWSRSKLKGLGEIEMASVVIDDDYAVIDDRLAFSTKEMALKGAKDLGCEGYHEHEMDGKTWYMPCGKHTLAEVPQNAKYTTDYDLLPNKHPKSSKS